MRFFFESSFLFVQAIVVSALATPFRTGWGPWRWVVGDVMCVCVSGVSESEWSGGWVSEWVR